MRFATTLMLLSALILSGSSVLAIPVPATEAMSNDLASLAARELSYESSVEARAFGLEERGLRSILSKWQRKLVGPSKKELAEQERRAFDFDAVLEERGLRSGLSKLKQKITGGGAAPAADLRRRAELVLRDLRTLRYLSLRRRELEGEIVERAPKRTHAGTI
ncbi:hypothetical protein D9611_013122 [Ephemerocybe angulata]|uniref:Periplasmic heavy metal sensor n=1 Tax=Ephemerocybe angulata TaxID=980116 RepID=A0A8H5FBZ4_9AGAR|nr:hypothetical protein D9611_013122 [Tulosesus angulatus]